MARPVKSERRRDHEQNAFYVAGLIPVGRKPRMARSGCRAPGRLSSNAWQLLTNHLIACTRSAQSVIVDALAITAGAARSVPRMMWWKPLAVAVGTFAAGALAVGVSSNAALAGHGVSDGVISLSVPAGWHSSLMTGVEVNGKATSSAAWLLIGNFPFAADAAASSTLPPVRRRGILIVIGNLAATGSARQWKRVLHPTLSAHHRARTAILKVRFHDRALLIRIEFGSLPETRRIHVVNRLLKSISRVSSKSK